MSESETTTATPRVAPSTFNERGNQLFEWSLSTTLQTDLVVLPVGPEKVLPVIFVPGIMGSNLKSIPEPEGGKEEEIWRLDSGIRGLPTSLLRRWGARGAGKRQRELHPQRTTVDNGGAVPTVKSGTVGGSQAELLQRYRDRGWGEVAETSYHEFLLWLEKTLNSGLPPHKWEHFPAEPGHLTISKARTPTGEFQYSRTMLKPGQRIAMPGLPGSLRDQLTPVTTDDLLAAANFNMPVHACGYNWLDSNEAAAERLAERINEVITQYGKRCRQVAIVTHSMGGLVTRRCAQLPGMAAKIAGVVHGVMPATGAAVAYRRCKLGVKEEDYGVGLVMGSNGKEVTAVFAQAPGALQLLPTAAYGMGWLKVTDPKGTVHVCEPTKDPYVDIYLRRDRWWGLVREEWLSPTGGEAIKWTTYKKNISAARDFHGVIRGSYHPNSYVYYGADPKFRSFGNITWNLEEGDALTTSRMDPDVVSHLGFDHVIDAGTNPLHAGRESSTHRTRDGISIESNRHQWVLRCAMQDAIGDGTVPARSGSAPIDAARAGHVRAQARLPGFAHEPSFANPSAQQFTLYSLVKIAAST